MALGPYKTELALVADVIAGDGPAAVRFLDIAAAPIWSAVSQLTAGDRAAEAAFGRVIGALKARGFARLAGFQGRSSLAAFLALTSRGVLIEELAFAIQDSPQAAWSRFQRLFGRDIRRRIARRFPRADEAARDDIYQEVCLNLLQDDFKKLRKFSGNGSFEGYVLVTVDRLLIDQLRKEVRRRRLPAAVEVLPALEQAVFVEAAWNDAPTDPAALVRRLAGRFPATDQDQVRAALGQVIDAIHVARSGAAHGRSVSIDDAADRGQPLTLRDEAPNPEDLAIFLEEDTAREALIDAIKAAAQSLPTEERLYLQVFFAAGEALPPRAIAKTMGRPIEEVRQIQQRVQRRLIQIARALKTQTASV